MTEQARFSTRIRRLTAFRVPSFVRRTVPALLLVLAFVLPPVLVGGIGVARAMIASAGRFVEAVPYPRYLGLDAYASV